MNKEGGQPGLTVGLLVYPRFNGLDLVGPHEVLARLDAHCLVVSEHSGAVRSDRGLQVNVDHSFRDCPKLDVLVVVGGPGQSDVMENEDLLTFVRSRSVAAKCVAGVCTGALILAAAGLLNGRRATTHWLAINELDNYGAITVKERVVWDGNIVTGAGVSAGIDLALNLVGRLADEDTGRRIELGIEYDPAPPYGTGHPRSAPPELIEDLKKTSRFHADSD